MRDASPEPFVARRVPRRRTLAPGSAARRARQTKVPRRSREGSGADGSDTSDGAPRPVLLLQGTAARGPRQAAQEPLFVAVADALGENVEQVAAHGAEGGGGGGAPPSTPDVPQITIGSRQGSMASNKTYAWVPELNKLRRGHQSDGDSSDDEFYVPDSYHLKGDRALETARAKAQRRKLRTHPLVQRAIRAYWQLHERFMRPDSTGVLEEAILKREFVRINALVAEILLPEVDRFEAKAIAEENWKNDAGRRRAMNYAVFSASAFEIVDVWTPEIDAGMYHAFMTRLCREVRRALRKRQRPASKARSPSPLAAAAAAAGAPLAIDTTTSGDESPTANWKRQRKRGSTPVGYRQQQPQVQRLFRVFVSSVFRDFADERNILTKQVFPRLRADAAARGLTVVERDLRWGVVSARRGDVVRVCLEQVRDSHLLLGLLGTRYGYIPDKDEFPPSLLSLPEFAWLAGAHGLSMTELEIRQALHHSQIPCFFYLRDPGGPAARQSDDLPTEPAEHSVKLAALRALLEERSSAVRRGRSISASSASSASTSGGDLSSVPSLPAIARPTRSISASSAAASSGDLPPVGVPAGRRASAPHAAPADSSNSESDHYHLERIRRPRRGGKGASSLQFRLWRGYKTADEVAKRVLRDLSEFFDRELPAGADDKASKAIDQEANYREQRRHAEFALQRSQRHLVRPAYFASLDGFLAEPASKPFCVAGPSGSGKSSILAAWSAQRRDRHLVIEYYVGSSSQSESLRVIHHRIASEIRIATRGQGGIPQLTLDENHLQRDLSRWLARIPEASRPSVVLVVDGVDQIRSRGGQPSAAFQLDWLPRGSAHLHVIVSMDDASDAYLSAQRGGFPQVVVEPLDSDERERFVHRHLANFGKQLEEMQIQRIVRAPACASPRFLFVVIEELRLFGVYENVDAQIRALLRCGSIEELYRTVLGRLEREIGREMVANVLSLVWAGQCVTEAEILAILRVAPAEWTRLFEMARDYLFEGSGEVGLMFASSELTGVVRERYLPEDAAQARVRALLFAHRAARDGAFVLDDGDERLGQVEGGDGWGMGCISVHRIPIV